MLSNLKFKKGVTITIHKSDGTAFVTLSPSLGIIHAMQVANKISLSVAKKPIVITSCLDGVHMPGSLHYSGNAFDFRSRIYTVFFLNTICSALRKQLGPNYDVVIERTHIHVEFDPK